MSCLQSRHFGSRVLAFLERLKFSLLPYLSLEEKVSHLVLPLFHSRGWLGAALGSALVLFRAIWHHLRPFSIPLTQFALPLLFLVASTKNLMLLLAMYNILPLLLTVGSRICPSSHHPVLHGAASPFLMDLLLTLITVPTTRPRRKAVLAEEKLPASIPAAASQCSRRSNKEPPSSCHRCWEMAHPFQPLCLLHLCQLHLRTTTSIWAS